jgi:hypothetical protein
MGLILILLKLDDPDSLSHERFERTISAPRGRRHACKAAMMLLPGLRILVLYWN